MQFLFTSAGQSGVIKMKDHLTHGTRQVAYWRQTHPNSLAHPQQFLGEMDLTTYKIHFGSELRLDPPSPIVSVQNLSQVVATPKVTINLTGDWVRSAGGGETLHVSNSRVHGHPSLSFVTRIAMKTASLTAVPPS